MAKKKTQLTALEREQLLIDCLSDLMAGRATLGSVLVRLRTQVLQLTQANYAKFVGISVRTLSNLENDTGDQTIPTLDAAFKPFGLRLGLFPKNAGIIEKALAQTHSDKK